MSVDGISQWWWRQRSRYRRLVSLRRVTGCDADLSLRVWLDGQPRLFGMLPTLFQLLLVPMGLLTLSQVCLQFPVIGHYTGLVLLPALIVVLWWLAPRQLLSLWRLLLASLSAALLLCLLDYGLARMLEPQRLMAASEPDNCHTLRPVRGHGEPRRVCEIRIRIDGHEHLLSATGTGYWMDKEVPVALHRGLLGDYPRLIVEDGR